MERKYFTEEQIRELEENPYVVRASAKAITYTDEFRRIFMNKYQVGQLPSSILTELGFDPHVLGRKRINGIVERTHRIVKRGGAYEDQRRNLRKQGKTE